MNWTPRIILGGDAGNTSALMPRMTVGHGEALWPRCVPCRRAVSAYGIGEHVPGKYVELWVRCDGIADPYGGAHVRTYRAGIRIDLAQYPTGWTRNVQVDVLSRLALHPWKLAKWKLELNDPNTVAPK